MLVHHAEVALPLSEAPATSEAASAPIARPGKAATASPTLQRRRRLLDDTVSPRPPTPDELATQASPALQLAASCVVQTLGCTQGMPVIYI